MNRLYQVKGDLSLGLVVSEKRGRSDVRLPLRIATAQGISHPKIVMVAAKLPDAAKKFELPSAGAELEMVPAYDTPSREDAFAIVVGIGDYRSVTAVPYAARDAQAVKDYFVKALHIPDAHVRLLKDSWATRADLESALEVWLPNQLKARGSAKSQIYFYFSGHGAPRLESGETFLVPYDGDPGSLERAGYPLKRLYETLARLPVQGSLVVLDSCFSGVGGPRTLLAKGARPLVVLKQDDIPGKVVVLSAATGSQISGNFEEKQHGLLTYYFLHGFQEGGSSKGKDLMLRDLFSYVNAEVERQARADNREQQPQLNFYQSLGPWETEPLAIRR